MGGGYSIEGEATPLLVILNSIIKQVEQAMMSKLVCSMPPWPLLQLLYRLLPCLRFCPNLSQRLMAMRKCKPNKPFFPKWLFILAFHHSNSSSY